jgi:RNA polymerase sigma-70 factor, ECF subfamily
VRGLIGQVSVTARRIGADLLKPLARESDLRLTELSRAGNQLAFEALVRRHRQELHVYAARLMGAEGRAEDALQHALMSAWVALRNRSTEVANPRAWLYGIVHNSAVSVLRGSRHDTVELNEALEAPHTHASAETQVVVSEIFAALAEMPAPQRHALLMTAVAGSSHGEAASALGVSAGAVRGMVYRARAALRQAAAAVLPPGLVNWASGLGHRRLRLPVDATDAAATTSASAGVAAAVFKGAAVIAAVGALAGTGPALLPAVSSRAHHRSAAVHPASPPRHESSGPPRTQALSPPVKAPQPSVRADHDLAAIARGEAGHSRGHGRGQEQGRGSPGHGPEHGDGSGSSGSPGSGSPGSGSPGGGHGGAGTSSGEASSPVPGISSSDSSGPGPSGADRASGGSKATASTTAATTASPPVGSGGGGSGDDGGGDGSEGGRSGSGR